MAEAKYRVTPRHVFEGRKRYHRQRLDYWPMLVFKTAVLLVLVGLGFLAFKDDLDRLKGFYAFLATLVCLDRVADRLQAWRLFRDLPNRNQEVRLDFDDLGLRTRTQREESELPWSAFTKVVYFKDGFLLFRSRTVCFWIPVSAFGGAFALTQWERCLTAKIRRHRVVGRVVSPFAVRRRWWQVPGTTLTRRLATLSWLAPIAAMNACSLGIAIGRIALRHYSGGFLLAAGVLLALGAVLGGTALVLNRRHRLPDAWAQAVIGICVSVLLASVWLVTHRVGVGQVQAEVLPTAPHPPSSVDVSAQTRFEWAAAFPVSPPHPPFHWCTTRAVGPCLVVASPASVNELISGGQTSLYLWGFGGSRRVCDLVFWEW